MSEQGPWHAIDERTDRDNFHTSIYERDYDGLLIARCNQNGQHPEQIAAILRGGAGKVDGAAIIDGLLAEKHALEAELVAAREKNQRLRTSCGHCGELEVAFARAEAAEAELAAAREVTKEMVERALNAWIMPARDARAAMRAALAAALVTDKPATSAREEK